MTEATQADPRITPEVTAVRDYIDKTWGRHFANRLEVPLKKLFPEPENFGLKHIWRYGSADLVVERRRDGHVVAVVELGGAHHWGKKQNKNDARKWKLCEVNGVRCLTAINGIQEGLSRRKWRQLLGAHLFKPVAEEKKHENS